MFWTTIAVATLAATAAIVWPLLTRRHAAQPDAREEELRRLAVFRDRKHEIEREHAAGRLSDADAAQAQADLLRQVAVDLPDAASEAPGSSGAGTPPGAAGESAAAGPAGVSGTAAHAARPASWGVALLLVVAVPLVAIGVYRHVGTPELATAGLTGVAANGAPDAARIEAMIAAIETRTRQHPDDGEAWAMLAEARKLQGRHAEAVRAFEEATRRLPPDARLLTDFAESALLLAGGDFSGRPVELLEQALAANPSEPKAIALMGAAQYRLGNLERARGYLVQFQQSLQPGSEEAAQIAHVVERIDAEIAQAKGTPSVPGAPGAPATPGAPAVAGTPAVPAAPAMTGAPEAPAAPAGNAAAAAASTVSGVIEIDPKLAEQARAGGTLFVIARQEGGPPIPVAVLRHPGARLPLRFELGDADAMDPSHLPSSAGTLVLEARLSRSGEAIRQPGDLYGRQESVKPGQRGVTIVIDRVVP
ncbi:MAG: c-type cytochrome biogenesis protein CcmI [Burkholderiales bacterium 70-64]|nr:MAG: c-type cytochrome biogenesis protein CcmI [Burkholderiales bacterium 70-64]